MATAVDADADVYIGKFVKADDEERFIDLICARAQDQHVTQWTREALCTLNRRISG